MTELWNDIGCTIAQPDGEEGMKLGAPNVAAAKPPVASRRTSTQAANATVRRAQPQSRALAAVAKTRAERIYEITQLLVTADSDWDTGTGSDSLTAASWTVAGSAPSKNWLSWAWSSADERACTSSMWRAWSATPAAWMP